jgi:hypothetical protein
MRFLTATVFVAGLLTAASANAGDDARRDAPGADLSVAATLADPARGKQRDDAGAFVLAARSGRGGCAALAREERDARRRGDFWRADQLQDAYRDCRKRGG